MTLLHLEIEDRVKKDFRLAIAVESSKLNMMCRAELDRDLECFVKKILLLGDGALQASSLLWALIGWFADEWQGASVEHFDCLLSLVCNACRASSWQLLRLESF